MANGGIKFAIHQFSLVKAVSNAPCICKLRKNCLTGFDHCAMVLSKCIYDGKLPQRKKVYSKCATNFHCPHLNWLGCKL